MRAPTLSRRISSTAGRAAALMVLLMLVATGGLAAATPASGEVDGWACPTAEAPTGDLPHQRSIDCLRQWGLGDNPLPAAAAMSRSTTARLLTDLVVRAGTLLRTPVTDPFDDDDGHPDEAALAELAAAQILHGRDGAVAPEGRLTRAQLASVAVRTLELITQSALPAGTTPFTDIGQSPHRAAIGQAYDAGLMSGRTPTAFAPSATATFGQYATVAARMLGVAVDAQVIDPPLTPAAPFALTITPAQVSDSIPGQPLMLLVRVDRDDHSDQGAANVTVTSAGAEPTTASATVALGQVREIVVTPADLAPALSDELPVEARVPVVVTVTRGDLRQRLIVPLRVTPGTDELEPAAREYLAGWIDWLADAHPELGIGADTVWDPAIVRPHILVVSHYLFFSPDWELGLTWHVMIPPYDWTQIYLRPRDEALPTLAFELPSVSDATAVPRPIDPPPAVDR